MPVSSTIDNRLVSTRYPVARHLIFGPLLVRSDLGSFLGAHRLPSHLDGPEQNQKEQGGKDIAGVYMFET
jgi:hypothetical protein